MRNASLAFDIAASGMAAQQTELDVIAQNLANAQSVDAQTGAPYRQRSVLLEPTLAFGAALRNAVDDFSISLDGDDPQPQGVRIAAIVEGAPHSVPRQGNVRATSVDPIEQMTSLIATGRAYDANVAMLQAAKQMEVEAADIDRA